MTNYADGNIENIQTRMVPEGTPRLTIGTLDLTMVCRMVEHSWDAGGR